MKIKLAFLIKSKSMTNFSKETEDRIKHVEIMGDNLKTLITTITTKKYETDTILTPTVLNELQFINKGLCPFEMFNKMNYWVKNGVCLFYNTPISTDYQDSYYIGYAEMRMGEYFAVGFRWIDNLEELTKIYEGITGKLITNDNIKKSGEDD